MWPIPLANFARNFGSERSGFFVTAIIGVVSFPVLLSAALLLIMDRSFGTSFFLSDIFIQGEVLHYQGGSPVLYEHLFWFLGHPEV